MRHGSWALWIIVLAAVMAACSSDGRSNPVDTQGGGVAPPPTRSTEAKAPAGLRAAYVAAVQKRASYSNATYQAAAYVFVLSGGVWTQVQELPQDGATGTDENTGPVAIDGGTVLVGSAVNVVYVFVRSGISLHLQLLRRIVKEGAPGAEEALAGMEQALRRGVETVERLCAFSRQSPESRIEPVDVDAVAREAIELSRPRIASTTRTAGVLLVAELGAPPSIPARSSEIMSGLLNLIVNAIDAMPDGGTVTVSTGAADRSTWVRVADDGPGIPDEIRARIFEPFFTTKGAHGTGLGLATVHALTQRYGGKVTLDTAPLLGTRFTLWFPSSTEGPAVATARS
jgi:hypothetical protein